MVLILFSYFFLQNITSSDFKFECYLDLILDQ